MFAENSRTLSWSEAAKRTFSPEGQCDVCRVVSHAKQEQQAPAPNGAEQKDAKTPLAYEPATTIWMEVPASEPWRLRPQESHSRDRAAPPRRPPRMA